MKISLVNKLPNILTEFVDSRLMPTAPPMVKFMLGGAVPIILSNSESILNTYKPFLVTLGIFDESTNQLDIDKASSFIRAGFEKSGKIPFMGFTFDKLDGEFLIELMEKYSDDGIS